MITLVTGASGFIGQMLCAGLLRRGSVVRSAVRRSAGCPIPATEIEPFVVGAIGGDTDWRSPLFGCGTVVHLAARVHVMHDRAGDPLAEFRCVNTEGTLNLARQAAGAGVRRFVFISSIKVNGEQTAPRQPFTAADSVSPDGDYAISKWDAEQGLMALAAETGMEVVIIRPPLVYGPGVKANFLNMLLWLSRGVPLPFGAIHNKRSLVALDNLVDLIITCTEHPAAANEVFLVSDGEDMSTTELLRRTAAVLGKPARLLPVPERLLVSGLRLLGKGDLAQRLCGSLQVDIGKTRELLGWTPPVSVDEGLRRTVAGFGVKG